MFATEVNVTIPWNLSGVFFYLLALTNGRENIVWDRIFEIEFSPFSHILRSSKSNDYYFGCWSVCVSVYLLLTYL